MFTESEANALITAEFIIKSCNDESLIQEFSVAIEKIKAVIPSSLKDRTERLEKKIGVTRTYTDLRTKSKYLLGLQRALVEYIVIRIEYINASNIQSVRDLEPFAIYSNQNDEWVMVAYCRLRDEFRTFSLTSIRNLTYTNEKFEPHSMTFAEFRKKTYGN